VVGADAAFGESKLTYSWSVLSSPPGAPTPAFTRNGTNTSKLVGIGIAAAGTYSFQVTIQAPDGQTAIADKTLNATLPVPQFAYPAFAGPTRTTGTPLLLGAYAADPAFDESALTYTWTLLSKPANARVAHFSANNSSAAKLTSITLSKAGTYVFQVRVTNPFGQSVESQVSVLVAAPSRSKRRG